MVIGVAVTALHDDLVLHPGRIRQAVHRPHVELGHAGGHAETEPRRRSGDDVPGLGAGDLSDDVTSSACKSSIGTKAAAASAIAASTSGAMRLPPRRVSVPLALITVRRPSSS